MDDDFHDPYRYRERCEYSAAVIFACLVTAALLTLIEFLIS